MKRVFVLLGLLVLVAGCGGGMEGTALLDSSQASGNAAADYDMPPPPPALDEPDTEQPPVAPESELPPGPPGL